jgi:tetratricopeptide (TPR) repeat protein
MARRRRELVVGQDLRSIVVQIQHGTTHETCGTGVIVSTDGKVATCAHVVVAAGINPRAGAQEPSLWRTLAHRLLNADPMPDPSRELRVVQVASKRTYHAKVIAHFPDHDDDVVLLQIVDLDAPLAPHHVARLGDAAHSLTHTFITYGYVRLGPYPAAGADGKIVMIVDPPDDRQLQLDPVQLRSSELDRGMSGAPVLDQNRNLVVGLVAEVWRGDASGRNRDTAWAVNACVTTLAPFDVPLESSAVQRMPGPRPTDTADVKLTVRSTRHAMFAWNNAPPSTREWVGREDLLKALTNAWRDEYRRVVSLVGFGGEGKSSVARRWLERLARSRTDAKPRGVFWWSFDERSAVDEFLEAALAFMAPTARSDAFGSADARARAIGQLIARGRFILVLDGVDQLQHHGESNFGSIANADLRQILGYLASGYHRSFCIVTTRVPLVDLMPYSSYSEVQVGRLTTKDGVTLLKALGASRSDAALTRIVENADGHALTLTLLARYATEYSGTPLDEAARAPSSSDVHEQLHALLRQYDKSLSAQERQVLGIASTARRSVPLDLLSAVAANPAQHAGAPGEPPAGTSQAQGAAPSVTTAVDHLCDLRLLRRVADNLFACHPLVRHYYSEWFKARPDENRRLHQHLRDFYLESAAHTQPTRYEALAPAIEAVYHMCQMEDFDGGAETLRNFVYFTNFRTLVNRFGAYDTAVDILEQFFAGADLQREPLVKNARYRGWIFDELGLSLMSLGRLALAKPFFDRERALAEELKDSRSTSFAYQNLSEVLAYAGDLSGSVDAADQAIRYAAQDRWAECYSICRKAWAEHLRGRAAEARELYDRADRLQGELDGRHLYSQRGVQFAEFLLRTDQPERAREISRGSLALAEQGGFIRTEGQSHRILGDVDMVSQNVDSARQHYDIALRLARHASHLPALIEALIARGNWKLLRNADDLGRTDLEEALTYAAEGAYVPPRADVTLRYARAGGYLLYEADIRLALARYFVASGDEVSARSEFRRVEQLTNKTGYHWGAVELQSVIGQVGLT